MVHTWRPADPSLSIQNALQANCAVEATIDECLRQLTAVANAARRRAARRARAAGAQGILGRAACLQLWLARLPWPSLHEASTHGCGPATPPVTHIPHDHTMAPAPAPTRAAVANGSEGGGGMRRGIPSWVHMPSLGLPLSESKEALLVRAGSLPDELHAVG